MEKKIYTIPEQNIEALKARLEKLNKRSRRLGVAEIVLTQGAPIERQDSVLRVIRYIPVSIEGASPIINGYKFIAVLDHVADIGTIVRALPGEQIGVAYRDAKPNCDHCQSNRKRKDTYLIRNEDTGDVKQVGSSCLKDFLGHESPESIAANAEALATLNGLCEGYERAPADFSDRYRVPLLPYLGFVAQEIMEHGWTSRKDARENSVSSTSENALSTMYSWVATQLDTQMDKISEEAMELARGSMEWAESLQDKPADELSDYEHNLMVVFKLASIESRSCGLAASAVFCQKRNLEKQAEEARKKLQAAMGLGSKHVGTIDKREVFTLTLTDEKIIDTQFGVTHLYKFTDPAGNLVVWFSSNDEKFEAGKTYKIKATVKKHDMYNGINQTVVNRGEVYRPHDEMMYHVLCAYRAQKQGMDKVYKKHMDFALAHALKGHEITSESELNEMIEGQEEFLHEQSASEPKLKKFKPSKWDGELS